MSELTPLTGAIRKSKYLVLDIESKDGFSDRAGFTRPFLCGVYDGVNYRAFRDTPECIAQYGKDPQRYFRDGGCVDQMMRHVLRRRYRGWKVYAHNAGRFDYLFLLPWLMFGGTRNDFKFSVIPVASSVQVLDVWRLSRGAGGELRHNKWSKWRFLDSIKLIPTALDKAAKAFGLEGKLKHDLDLPESDPRWEDYLRQDCVQLYGVVEKFHHYIENVLCGEVGITAPATSVKTFRRQYLKKPIPRTVECHDFIRSGYVGGRVEVFRRRGEGLRYYDINSSYPASMLEDMPVGQGTYWKGEPPEWFLKKLIGFCKVDVTVPDMHIPPLPVKPTKKQAAKMAVPEKLLFPVGRLSGVWEWGELQQAISMGATVERFHESWWFEGKPIFKSFVEDLYPYRDKSRPDYDEGLDAVVKILLNALYGKFGMRTLRKTIYQWDDPEMPDCAVPANQDKSPDSLIWYAEEEVDAAYIMPQISARVTALSRVRLLRGLLQSIDAGGDVWYCDTDSQLNDIVIPTTTELGGWKDEYPEYSGRITGEFLGPKLYMLCAGDDWTNVRAKGLQDRTPANFHKLKEGQKVIVRRLEKIGTLARADFLRGPVMMSVPRTLRPEAGKRIMHADGSTSPYRLEMW